MLYNYQTVTAIIIVLITALVLYFTKPSYAYTPHGIYLSAVKQQKELAAVPVDTVTLYQTPPAQYQLLGYANVELGFKVLEPHQAFKAISYVRTLAARYGANGLIIYISGIDPVTSAYILQTKAIIT